MSRPVLSCRYLKGLFNMDPREEIDSNEDGTIVNPVEVETADDSVQDRGDEALDLRTNEEQRLIGEQGDLD